MGKGKGQPTWSTLKEATMRAVHETIDEVVVLMLWAVHEAGLSPRTLKRVWKEFNRIVELKCGGYVSISEVRRQLKEETGITIVTYKDWGKSK